MIHFSVVTIIYTLSCAVGLYQSVHILPAYRYSYVSAQKVSDPEDRKRAVGYSLEYLVGECLRCSVHLLSTIVGVWSMFITPETRVAEPLNNQLFGFALIVLLLWANIALTINTIFKRYSFERRSGTSSWTSTHIARWMAWMSVRFHRKQKEVDG